MISCLEDLAARLSLVRQAAKLMSYGLVEGDGWYDNDENWYRPNSDRSFV
jgi:hypothetical protein